MPLRSFSIASLSPKPLMVTLAPCSAIARAMARPMPEVEPVTSADFPFNMTTPNSLRSAERRGAKRRRNFYEPPECAALLVAAQHKKHRRPHVFAIPQQSATLPEIVVDEMYYA